MHVTYLAARGVTRELIERGYKKGDVRDFAKGLREQLEASSCRSCKPVAAVDHSQPLIAAGTAKDLLALNLKADARMLERRAAIEDYLEAELGELPGIVPFRPHITLGRVYGWAFEELTDDPMRLVPKKVHIPATVALNGVACYIGRIHPQEP